MYVCIERFFTCVNNIVSLVKDLTQIPFYFFLPKEKLPSCFGGNNLQTSKIIQNDNLCQGAIECIFTSPTDLECRPNNTSSSHMYVGFVSRSSIALYWSICLDLN